MLRSTKTLAGYRIAANDGAIGKVKDFLFDEQYWVVRYMVADTGDWLPKRKVLISPVALGSPDWSSRLFPVRLTREQIEHAPDLDTEAPVSREYEKRWFDSFGWPYYWTGTGVWGSAATPAELYRARDERGEEPSPEQEDRLRSVREVDG